MKFNTSALVFLVKCFSRSLLIQYIYVYYFMSRCVPDNQRGYALGLQFLFIRAFGSLIGPIIFGRLIDTTCTLWQKKCSVRGNCLNYDHVKMSLLLLASALPINGKIYPKVLLLAGRLELTWPKICLRKNQFKPMVNPNLPSINWTQGSVGGESNCLRNALWIFWKLYL